MTKDEGYHHGYVSSKLGQFYINLAERYDSSLAEHMTIQEQWQNMVENIHEK